MKNTKDNVVKLLKAMSKNSMEMARIAERDDSDLKKWRRAYIAEANAYDIAIAALTDQKYFNDICEVMKIEDD